MEVQFSLAFKCKIQMPPWRHSLALLYGFSTSICAVRCSASHLGSICDVHFRRVFVTCMAERKSLNERVLPCECCCCCFRMLAKWFRGGSHGALESCFSPSFESPRFFWFHALARHSPQVCPAPGWMGQGVSSLMRMLCLLSDPFPAPGFARVRGPFTGGSSFLGDPPFARRSAGGLFLLKSCISSRLACCSSLLCAEVPSDFSLSEIL